MLLTPQSAAPRCQATVDLASIVERPYRFYVTVKGEPPHAFVRGYQIIVPGDLESAANGAAIRGMELFCAEFGPKIPGVASAAPKAKLA